MIQPFYWWFYFCLIGMPVIAFLIFGIYLLILSFNLKDPLIAVTLFFSSSLMILVSLSLIAGLIARGIEKRKHEKEKYSGA